MLSAIFRSFKNKQTAQRHRKRFVTTEFTRELMIDHFRDTPEVQSKPYSNPMGWVLFCLILASAIAGLIWHGRTLLLTGSLLLIVASGMVLPHLAIRGLSVGLLPFSNRGQVGNPLRLRLHFQNSNWFAWGTTIIRIAQQLPGQPKPDWIEHMVGRLKRRSESPETITIEPTTRGYLPSQPLELLTRFPFGLTTAKRTISLPTKVIVWPEVVPMGSSLAGAKFAGRHSLESNSGTYGEEGDISGPRPYRPGESLRRVHWRHTARTGQLIVCDRESTSSRNLRILLRVSSLEKPTPEERQAKEIAICLAASMVAESVAQHWRVDLEIAGYRTMEGIDRRRLGASMDWLATFRSEERRVGKECR